jgi:sugar diacid utilization regulator
MERALESAVATLREELTARLGALADVATERIVAEIPAYRSGDATLRADVHAHILAHLRANVETFGSDREITREELLFVRPHAARRARRVSLAEFVHAFYVGERVLWEAALALTHDDESRQAALLLASHLPRYFEVATTHAAEVYVETQEALTATGERIRRDLLEDLLAGRELEPGPRSDAAQAAGLRVGSPCLAVSAEPVGDAVDEQRLRGGAAGLGRAVAPVAPPLAVVRRDEIVVIAADPRGSPGPLEERLADVQRRLADGGLPLRVGVSTTVGGLEHVAAAYREARRARGTLSLPGVVMLSTLTAFDYLTLSPDPTAQRLIAPAVHEFVVEDAREGGTLVATLREYAACDLNAKRAAAALHIHVNTAHYRLGRIAERTGCNLRRVGDLIEILIAARLAEADAREAIG